LPNPKDRKSSGKTVDSSLPEFLRRAVLDEKAQWPQCQKMVSKGDLFGGGRALLRRWGRASSMVLPLAHDGLSEVIARADEDMGTRSHGAISA